MVFKVHIVCYRVHEPAYTPVGKTHLEWRHSNRALVAWGATSKAQTSSLGLCPPSPSGAASCQGCRAYPAAPPLGSEVALSGIPRIGGDGQAGGIEVGIVGVTAPLPHIPCHPPKPKWRLALGQIHGIQRKLVHCRRFLPIFQMRLGIPTNIQ